MKKKILFGALGLATVLVPLASCKDDETSTTPVESTEYGKYDVALGKPMMLYNYDEEFSWAPVEGAKGYVAKLDNGTPFGIGNPIYESDEGKMCVYVQNLDGLSVGEHKISFAAYDEKDNLSDWTDSYTFYVEDKTITLSRPILYSGLSVRADEEFDSVTYDFGNNIKLTIDVNGNSYFLNEEDLEQVKGLVDGQSYVVKCTIKKGNVESQVSNPITYKYSKSYYNQSVNTYVDGQTFKFEEELDAPTLTVKVNDKDYIINTNSSISEVDITDLFEIIVEEKLATTADLLSAEEIKVSVKVNYDSQHYSEGTYSEEIIYDQTQFKDYEFFLTLYEQVDYGFEDYKLNLAWNADLISEYGYDGFVTFTATKDNGTEIDITQSAIKGEIGSIDCTDAEVIHLKVTYTRAGYTNSKVIDIEVPTQESVSISKVSLGTSSITWNTSSSDYDCFEVEIKNSSQQTIKCTTLNKSLSYDEFSLTGDLSITVYAVKNNERIEDSKSLTINVSRKTAPGSLSVTNGYVTLNEGQVLVVDGTIHQYNKNYNSYNKIYIANASNVSSYYIGDYIYSIRSETTNYVIDRISNFDYKIENGKYLVLEGYDISNLIDDNYGKYLDDDKRFDLSAYYRNTHNQSLTISGSDITNLSPTSKNTVISGRISFSVTPDVEIINDYSKETTLLEFETDSIYDGKYEIIIEKYNEDKEKYEEIKTDTIGSTSYSLSSLEKGKYKIYVGTIGNGYVVSGDKNYIYYIVNEDKIVDDVEIKRYSSSTSTYTFVNFIENNLCYSCTLSYKYSSTSSSISRDYYDTYSSYPIRFENASKLNVIAKNTDSQYLYRYLPEVTLSLTTKNYNNNYGKYCYDVSGYTIDDAYYIYQQGYSYSYTGVLSAKYEKDGKIYDKYNPGTVTIKEAEGENPEETIEFVSLKVSNFNQTTVDYTKYYSSYSLSSNNDVASIIVDKSETKIATYLNKVTKFTSVNYVYKYQKVSTGENVDTNWYKLSDEVKLEEISKLKIVEDYEEYQAKWFTDKSKEQDCKVKLYKDGKAEISYTSGTSNTYTAGLYSNNNIDGTCKWGFVDEPNKIIYFEVDNVKKVYKLDIVEGTIEIYNPTLAEDAKTYAFNTEFGDEYLDLSKVNDSIAEYQENIELMEKMKKVSFKVSGDYVLRYYDNELMETLIIDIDEYSDEYESISIPYTVRLSSSSYYTEIKTILLGLDGKFIFTK